jgi:hypothetical protein
VQHVDQYVLHPILAGFAECLYGELDLITSAPLQRWDPELPNAPAEAGDHSSFCVGHHRQGQH